MDFITIQGTGIGPSPTRGREADLEWAVGKAQTDAIIKASVSPNLVSDLDVLIGPNTREFAQKIGDILSRAGEYVLDTVSSQESYMPSGRLKAIYTYVIDATSLRTILYNEGILGVLPKEQEPPPPDPPPEPEPVDMVLLSPTHEIVATELFPLEASVRPRPTIKSKIIGRIPITTKVRVRSEYVGIGCEWHEIHVADEGTPSMWKFGPHRQQPIYIHRSQIVPLPNTPPSLEVACACKKARKHTPPDWRMSTSIEPFLDKPRCEYSIVVPTRYTSTGGILLEERKADAISVGVLELLKFYDKQILVDNGRNVTMERLFAAFKFAYVEPGACGWHLNERPGSRLKILVRVPAKYFDALPRKVDNLVAVAIPVEMPEESEAGGADVADDDAAEPALAVPPLPPAPSREGWRTTNFVIKRLKKKIEMIGNTFDNTDSQIKAFRGQITVNGLPVDLAREYEALEAAPAAFVKLLAQNGFKPDIASDDTVEVGFNRDFGVEYVLSNKGESSVPCRIGFSRWKKAPPVDNPTTMALLFYIDDIIKNSQRSENDAKPWTELLGDYIFPVPDIKLSAMAPKLEELGSLASIKLPAGLTPGSLDLDVKLDVLNEMKGLQVKFDNLSLKSLDDLDLEELSIKVPDLKLKLADIQAGKLDFIGDNLFANAAALIPKIGSMDDMFSEFLNKVSLPDVTKLLAALKAGEMPYSDVLGSMSMSAMKLGSLEDLINIKNELPMIAQLKIDSVLSSFDTGFDFKSAWQGNISDRLSRLELRRAGEIVAKITELDMGKFPKLSDIDFNLNEYTSAVGDAADLLDGELPENWSARAGALLEEQIDNGLLKDIKMSPELLNLKAEDLSFAKVESLLTGGRVLDLRGKLSLDGVDVNLGDIEEFVNIQSSSEMLSSLENTAEGILNRYGSDLTARAEILRDSITSFVEGSKVAELAKKYLPEEFSKIEGLLDGRLDNIQSKISTVLDAIPTIKLPDKFPIFDTEPTDEDIINSVLDAVKEALMGEVTKMLEGVSKYTQDMAASPESLLPPGAIDFAQSLSTDAAEALSHRLGSAGIDVGIFVPSALALPLPDAPDPAGDRGELPELPEDPAERAKVQSKRIRAATLARNDNFDMPPAALEEMEEFGGERASVTGGSAIRRFLEDISSVLKPEEVCGLFAGTPTQETGRVVKNIVSERYPILFEQFSSTANITSFFRYLGTFVDPGLCRGVAENLARVETPLNGLPCSDTRTELRAAMLDGRASIEQIEDLTDKVRDKDRARLTKLLDIAAGEPLLANAVPPILSDCEEDEAIDPEDLGISFNALTTGVRGIVKRSSPSTEAMNNHVIGGVIDSIDVTFSNDCTGFLESIIEDSDPRPINPYDEQWDMLLADIVGKAVDREAADALKDWMEDTYAEQAIDGKLTENTIGKLMRDGVKSDNLYKPDKEVLTRVRTAMTNTENVTARFEDGEFMGLGMHMPRIVPPQIDDETLGKLSEVEDLKARRRRKVSQLGAETRKFNKLTENQDSGYEESRLSRIRLRKQLDDIEGSLARIEGPDNERRDVSETVGMADDVRFETVPNAILVSPQPFVNDTDHWKIIYRDSPSASNRKSIEIEDPMDPAVIDWISTRIRTSDVNPRGDMLANIFWEATWSDIQGGQVRGGIDSDMIGDSDYWEQVRDKVFPKLLAHFLSKMMKYVADTAPFFEPTHVSDLELNPGKLGYVSEDPCKPNPPEGLLRIKNLKESIKKEYKNSCGVLDPNTTGPFQQAMTTGITQLAVRVGTVENFLRGLQTIERFTPNDLRSGVLANFIAGKIRTSLKNDYRSASFSRDFLEKIKKAHQDKIQSGYTIMDPITGRRDERIHDSAHPDTISGFSALRNMTAHALATMREAMDDQFEDMGLPGGQASHMIETLLMGPDVPMMSVPTWRGEPRFTRLLAPGGRRPGGQGGQNANRVLLQDPKYREGVNFVLERYVRVVPKHHEEGELQEEVEIGFYRSLQELFHTDQYVREATAPDRAGGNRDEIEWVWVAADANERAATAWGFGEWDTVSGVVMSHQKFWTLIKTAIPLINNVGGNDWQAIKRHPVNKWFDISEGLRYVYVSPIEPSQTARATELAGTDWNVAEELSAHREWLFLPDEGADILAQAVAERTKAHYLVEKHLGIAHSEFGNRQARANHEYLVSVITTPLASVEVSIPERTMDELWLAYGVLGDEQGTITEAVLRDTKGIGAALARQLLNSEDLRMLFHHLVPMKTLATLTYMYNAQATDFNALQTKGAFASSKESIRSAFYSMTPVAEDMKTAEDANLESLGGQAGMYKATSAISSNRIPIEFPGLWKIAAATVPILIKGLATEMDPHYKLVNQIDQGLEWIGAGGLPTGMTWASVPFLWPITLSIPPIGLIGWGPPLTPLGAAAYSFGEFDRSEKKRKKKRKQEKKRSSNNNKCD